MKVSSLSFVSLDDWVVGDISASQMHVKVGQLDGASLPAEGSLVRSCTSAQVEGVETAVGDPLVEPSDAGSSTRDWSEPGRSPPVLLYG